MQYPPAQPPPTPLAYATPGVGDQRWGKGFLAVCGTLVFWGVGHWIAGYRRRGAVWFFVSLLLGCAFAAALIVPSLVAALLVVIPLWLILLLAVLVDAFFCGRRSIRSMLGRPMFRYLAGIGLLLCGVGAGQLVGRGSVLLFQAAGARTFAITSSSMRPTLQPGDRIIANRTPLPNRWDVEAYHPPVQPEQFFAGRIVGLPGEKVEIVNGRVLIDDRVVQPTQGIGPYVGSVRVGPQTGCEGHPIHLEAGEYFILGDNSRISYDSRYWAQAAPGHQLGAVPRDWTFGRANAIYWPLNRIRQLH